MGFWLGAAVPVALVRKAYSTVTHTTAPPPKSFLTPGPLCARVHVLQAHVFGALAVLAVHAARFRYLLGEVRENPPPSS
ncbi:hypothetical protein C8F04DRAFT_1166686, partial [Mycena alexandri]